MKDNTTYFYRLKALGDKPESDFGTAEGLTLKKLNLPELSVNIVSNQSLKVSWKTVINATSYLLERKANLNDSYKELAKFGADKTTYSDSLLKDNVTYFYRIKALGTNTESDFVMAENSTPQKLNTPELSVNTTSYQSLKITWKAITKATSYTLERKANPNDAYKELVKLTADKTTYSDSLLKDNFTYFYRLKAFGDKTESDVAVAQGITAQILILEEDLTNIFTLFPNPTNTEIHLKFMKPVSGKLSVFNTIGISFFETELKNQTIFTIPVYHFRKGVYFVKFSGLEGEGVRKVVVE